jgi:hypothetical protein
MKVSEMKQYLDFLLDINPKNSELEIVVRLNEPSHGPTASTDVIGIVNGFDWNSGKVIISTDDDIIRKNT